MSNLKTEYLERSAPKWGQASAVLQWKLLILRGAMLLVIVLGMILLFAFDPSTSLVVLWFVLATTLLASGMVLQIRNYRVASKTLGVRLTLTSLPPSNEAKYLQWCRSRHLTPYSTEMPLCHGR